jgi:hypothetical protein
VALVADLTAGACLLRCCWLDRTEKKQQQVKPSHGQDGKTDDESLTKAL